jgi:hypothetical protein
MESSGKVANIEEKVVDATLFDERALAGRDELADERGLA